MSNRITEFNTELHEKINAMKKRLDGLKDKTKTEADEAKQAVQEHVKTLEERLKGTGTKIKAAEEDISEWVDETRETIEEWQTKREHKKLESRVKRADKYATAAFSVAMDAVDKAEKAMLQAWLAHADYDPEKEKAA